VARTGTEDVVMSSNNAGTAAGSGVYEAFSKLAA
jgi:hypothetical protein